MLWFSLSCLKDQRISYISFSPFVGSHRLHEGHSGRGWAGVCLPVGCARNEEVLQQYAAGGSG